MGKRYVCLALVCLAIAGLAACGEPTPTLYTNNSIGLDTPGTAPATAAPTPDTRTLSLPEAEIPPHVEDPSELRLDGGLTWMWQSPLDEPMGLAALDSMCAAVIGKDQNGADCLYAGQVYEFGQALLYTAAAPYERIGSVSGGYFSVYFVEYGQDGWRLLHLPLDSSPEQAVQVDAGTGFVPVLNPSGEYLVYAAQNGEAYEIRLLEKQPRELSSPARSAGTIPLPSAPLEPERTYSYHPEVGVTYTVAEAQGYSIVTARPGGEIGRLHLQQQPYLASQTPWELYFLLEGSLYCYDTDAHKLWILGEDVRFFLMNDLGTACLLADQGGTRVQYVALSKEAGEMLAITLAQGNWVYTRGVLYAPDEMYILALRQREEESQFTGMELALAPN